MSKETVNREYEILRSKEALECAIAIQELAIEKTHSVHLEADKDDSSPLLVQYFCQGELLDYLKMMRGAQILTEQTIDRLKVLEESFWPSSEKRGSLKE